jgi:hypothetical protein
LLSANPSHSVVDLRAQQRHRALTSG